MHLIIVCVLLVCFPIFGQEYGNPDRESPGDPMIQEYLRLETTRMETNFPGGIKTAENWNAELPRYRQEYMEMLGLSPLPQKTPLKATITHTLDRGEYKVDCLHYQSRPGLYVTGNLYRPASTKPGERLPAIFYVCGHSGRGRNGNKTAFQSHGIWLARHGYICLIVDTLQWSEIAGVHHGTYREGRWWWLSRGYTPAGVECWNGIRGIDYLVSRPDVDPDRIGVTGISGGGAATFWIAAADDRVKVAVPVSGMADLTSYVPNRVINGHCDCMFLYNAYQWPWTRIAGLIAPRPMLFMNSDQDVIFPMDANERVINRLERLYALFGASDRVDSFVSLGGHDYRKDIRQASFRFLNTYLKNDPSPINDSEIDLVSGPYETIHPIPPEELRAFRTDADLPNDAVNNKVDEQFVPIARPGKPTAESADSWRNDLLKKLRALTFHHFPDRVPAAVAANYGSSNGKEARLTTESNIQVPLTLISGEPDAKTKKVVLLVTDRTELAIPDDSLRSTVLFALQPRGVGPTRWTTRNPPNYVERAHYLLGRTTDSGRIWDIAATARYLKEKYPDAQITVAGEKRAGVLAIYAALLEPDIKSVRAINAPDSLMAADAPVLLNALRVCDIPDAIRMLAPREFRTSW